jgi:hypothetical protein
MRPKLIEMLMRNRGDVLPAITASQAEKLGFMAIASSWEHWGEERF